VVLSLVGGLNSYAMRSSYDLGASCGDCVINSSAPTSLIYLRLGNLSPVMPSKSQLVSILQKHFVEKVKVRMTMSEKRGPDSKFMLDLS